MTAARHPRASRIGFGCASLGSRVGAKAGLAALNRAFDRGINWFDLAPSYGDGLAENVFSHFSRGRRSEIHIATKFGISPPQINLVASALRPIARGVLSYAPFLRSSVSRGRPRAARIPLTPESITDGIEQSLRRLGTDYVDVLALHDPDPRDLKSDGLRHALGNFLTSGKARAIGIAGSLEAAIGAIRLGLPIGYVQIANNPLQRQIDPLVLAIETAGVQCNVVTHSAFGQKGSIEQITGLLESHPALKASMLGHYNLPIEDSVRAALIDYALQTNHSGTVLFSMFSPDHLEFNLQRLNSHPSVDAKAVLDIWRTITAIQQASGGRQVQ